VVTQAMTSLTGSAGEDFASILRALGYRMDRRPPLAEKVPEKVETVAADAPPVEAAVQEVSGDPAPSASLLPGIDFGTAANDNVLPALAPVEAEAPAAPEAAPVAEEAPVVEAAVEPVVAETPAELSAEVAAGDAAPAETAAAETASAETPVAEAMVAAEATAAAPEAAAEPALVEVWRPGGRHEERRPRHERGRHRHRDQRKPADGAQAAEGDAAAQATEGEKPGEHRGRRDRHRDFRKPREGGEGAPREGKREERGDRRERFEGKGKDERRDKFERKDRPERGGRDRDKGRDRRDRESGPSHRQYATSASPRDNRAADPNSPFAKLAALKEQLARKE
jgi:ATP-dependent RNA helicase SUPV3L1/SUV3